MATVLIFQHNDHIPPGLLGEALESRGIDIEVAHLYAGGPVPDDFDFDGVASLGGVMGVYEEEAHPWLVEEKWYLAEAVDQGIPVIGLCLGCQMLADALGGSAYKGPQSEYGLLKIHLNDAGREDSVVRHLDSTVPVFHGDTWDVPLGATLLASSDLYNHAFRFGSAVGIQAHPEASIDITTVWIDRNVERIGESGTDPETLRSDLTAHETSLRAMSDRLFGAWADEVLAGD